MRRRGRRTIPRRAIRTTTGIRGARPREERGPGAESETLWAVLFANAQILLDLVLLAALLHFAGGIGNPFLYFFIFHVIIASMLLSTAATYLHAGLGLSLVTVVGVGEAVGWLRHYPLGGPWAGETYRDPAWVGATLFVLGTILNLAAYMGSTIAGRLRAREREATRLSDALADKAQALVAAYDSVRRLERSKSQYLRRVSHELRGSLGTIQTGLKVVLGGTEALSEPSLDLLRRTERRAGEPVEVFQDLLHLAQAQEGPLPAVLGPARLDRIVIGFVAQDGAAIPPRRTHALA